VLTLASAAANGALGCVTGRAVERDGDWITEGDPMDAALDAFHHRLRAPPSDRSTPSARLPFTSATMSSAAAVGGVGYVLGAPEGILDRCTNVSRTRHEWSPG